MSGDDRTEGPRESAPDLSEAERRIDRRLRAFEERLDQLEENLRDLDPLRDAVADLADGMADLLAESREERRRVLGALDELPRRVAQQAAPQAPDLTRVESTLDRLAARIDDARTDMTPVTTSLAELRELLIDLTRRSGQPPDADDG